MNKMILRRYGLYPLLLFAFSLQVVFQACSAKPEQSTQSAQSAQSAQSTQKESDYLSLRNSHSTTLKRRGPAPQEWQKEKLLPGVTQVTYKSGDYELKAFLTMPKNFKSGKVPAVVYFHGGFAFGMEEFKDCQPFLDSGFAVMIPTLRGENGNPGNFELFYGEIDDARSAVLWLSEQSSIDASRIYTFGHSIGGGISALLSLWDNIPVRLGGSSGGLYPKDIFEMWDDIAPFDVNNDKERSLRLLVGNAGSMKRSHIAYIGRDDIPLRVRASNAESEIKRTNAPLTIKFVEGDHFSSLKSAVSDFTEIIKRDK